jgi:peroxiredoxin
MPLLNLADANIQVAALSVDDKETTAALVAKHKLTFPVGYGADAKAVAATFAGTLRSQQPDAVV